MAAALRLPGDGWTGMKLIRRSVAQLARDSGTVPVEEIEMQLGHRKIDSVSELYAPFQPDYLSGAVAFTEHLIDRIESAVPGAFHRSCTGEAPNVIPLRA